MPLEAAGLIVSAQTILGALQCEQLKDLFGSDLESFGNSVQTIQAVLLDADSSQANGIELNDHERNFIEQIKDVVYDADDLLDKYVTRAKQQQIRMESGNTLSEKVHGLYSRLKLLVINSHEFKRIANKLEKIGRDARNFKFVSRPITIKREDTSLVLIEDHIVGRENDQRRIVDLLLTPVIQGDLPVLAIVGVGGLGKTSLAQLVYNDSNIEQEFPLRMWVCVSDQDRNQFNLMAILADIYKSATREISIGEMRLDLLVQKLRSKLDQHKYLLVLDDLWNEKIDDCHVLVDILRGSAERDSRIVVTTRSKKTAKAIGSSRPYELHGLSDENSWHLFELKVGREIKGHDLFEIGKDIVKKCVNVPLAIKVVGSLLRDVPENEWESFQQSRLIDMKRDDNENDIMHILKFSYYHLSPSLKSCFTYCAIFPKDFKIQKENLIAMWMAHDYVKDEGKAEDHFQTLVQRCFFENISENHPGQIEFTIHDLMHDMAQEISGKEIYIAKHATTELDREILHLNDGAPNTRTNAFVTPAKIRSYVHGFTGMSYFSFPVSKVLKKWRCLRVLNLQYLGIIELPTAIGDLLHLRYLDLSQNGGLRMLPKALTKLINLQRLNLAMCDELTELPRDFKELVNLRNLYVPDSLEYMPLGMGGMTSLTKLNNFIVGHKILCVPDSEESMLESLRVARNLKGSLGIKVKEGYKHAKKYCGEGGYICNTHHLNSISIRWGHLTNEEGRVGNDEDLLEDLQPHRNLEELEFMYYAGVKIPRWAREDSLTTSLPNLVNIHLSRCEGLKELPWLGGLQHLKTLKLRELNVEYMENRRSIGSSSDDGAVASNSSTILFFPSLVKLTLRDMPKLTGWWRGSSIVNNNNNIFMLTTPAHPLPSFPCLSVLDISHCPNLTYIPPCPAMKTLGLNEFNGVIMIEEDKKRMGCSSGNVVGSSSTQYLEALPMVAFQCLVRKEITDDGAQKSLSKCEDVFRCCSSSLRLLALENCNKFRSVCGGGLEYLTALEELTLIDLPELEFDETEENEEDMPWRCLGKSLRSLKLVKLEKVDNLPKGMRYLTALESLEIENVPLKEIPEWIESLSSLRILEIEDCIHLEKLPRALLNLTFLNRLRLADCSYELHCRCEQPDGEYWPILEHIPQLSNSW